MDETEQAFQDYIDGVISRQIRFYKVTKNPLLAWEIIGRCIGHKRPIPEEMLQYLAQCAVKIEHVWAMRVLFKGGKDSSVEEPIDPPIEISKALSLYGERGKDKSPFKRYSREYQEIKVAAQIHKNMLETIEEYKTRYGRTPKNPRMNYDIISGVTYRQAQRIWNKYKSYFLSEE
jgi:hypothetical protein